MRRSQEREAAKERRREKERLRVALTTSCKQNDAVEETDDDDIYNEGDDDSDDDSDEDYRLSTDGHRRVKDKTIKLEINIDEYRKSFSLQADHRKLSSRGRSDVVSEQVMSGGGSLRQLPCSQSTMIRY